MTIAFQGMPNYATNFSNTNQQLKNVSFKHNFFQGLEIGAADNYERPKQDQVLCAPPKISFGRLQLNRLTKEQVEAVNISKTLPKNAKFTEFGGKVKIKWNMADFTEGTHELPQGYEVKNDIFGFTHVVREGTKSWILK